MSKKYTYRKAMVASALLAEEAMKDSPLAKPLKSMGFTPAEMAAAAKELTALHTQVQVAKAALVQASQALAAKAGEVGAYWSKYTNQVRALTGDAALRAKHGVKSPGVRKGPAFRRGKRVLPKPGAAPVADGAAPSGAIGHA